MNAGDGFVPLLQAVQEHISKHYAAALTDGEKHAQLKPYIAKFLRDKGTALPGYTTEELMDRLYGEMAEYSILTPYLGREDVEEINVNSWDDVAITYTNGRTEKLEEHFFHPQHAIDIVKHLLHHSDMIIDNAAPMAQGHLPGNTRITALKTPLVDDEVGISVSIRVLHPSSVGLEQLVAGGCATRAMIDFLCMCLRYGVSFVVAGATSSGKTTLLNALLSSVPDQKRVYTIESGARELSLVKRDGADRVRNNVVHTLSRPSELAAQDISQEDLVVASLRFNPDIVVVGEMRDVEAYAAVEASLTGHTVVSTVHATAADAAHMRLALLCQKRFPIDFATSLMQAGQAFPVVVYTHKLEDNRRKILDISECVITPEGKREYRCLFRYQIENNQVKDGKVEITGHFQHRSRISDSLRSTLLQYGVSQATLQPFLQDGEMMK